MGRLGRFRKDEAGQAIVFALVVVALVAALLPVAVSEVTAQMGFVARDAFANAALAAAEAGIQDYRNLLDNVPGYYEFSAQDPGSPPAVPDNPALTGFEPIAGSHPEEAFHYVPITSEMTAPQASSAFAGQVLLEVTGRAGLPGDYAYRTVLASFKLQGILEDSYFSQYEVTDPAQPGMYPQVTVTTPSGGQYQVPMTGQGANLTVSYSYTDANGRQVTEQDEPLWNALCQYHQYQENYFVDSLAGSQNAVSNRWVRGAGRGRPASASNPWYGPYYTNGTFSYTYPAGTAMAGDQISVASPCGAYPGYYATGNVFNGTAYSNDEMAFCGSPQFNGVPPLVSGAPSTTLLHDPWPGTVATAGGWRPLGYVPDFELGCSGSPSYGSGVPQPDRHPLLGGTEALPPTTTGLIAYADGAKGQGCLYTGPTMIEFVPGGTMNVWSPLTKETEPDLAPGKSAADCGTFSPGKPFATGIPVPSGQVIYVQNVPSSPGNPNYWASLPAASVIGNGQSEPGSGRLSAALVSLSSQMGTSCPDPFFAFDPYFNGLAQTGVYPTPAQCGEGDLVLGGELSGQLTIAADGNVMVSRDLTYGCVDQGGPASPADPSSVAACNAPGSSDVLGVVAQVDVVVADPGVVAGGGGQAQSAPACQSDGTEASPTLANILPDCTPNDPNNSSINGIVIDGAMVTLNGSTNVEDMALAIDNSPDAPGYLGNMTQNGTNINYYPGITTVGSQAGYNQILSYDTRLAYLTPPHLLQATDTVWEEVAFIECGSVNSISMSSSDYSCPSFP